MALVFGQTGSEHLGIEQSMSNNTKQWLAVLVVTVAIFATAYLLFGDTQTTLLDIFYSPECRPTDMVQLLQGDCEPH